LYVEKCVLPTGLLPEDEFSAFCFRYQKTDWYRVFIIIISFFFPVLNPHICTLVVGLCSHYEKCLLTSTAGDY